MIDELYRRLWKEVRGRERGLERSTREFLADFLEELRASGYELSDDAKKRLDEYFDTIEPAIRKAIEAAIVIVPPYLPVPSMRSEFVASLTEKAFKRRWPDGLTLSDRLWWWQDETRRGVSKILEQGARLGTSINRLTYEMQYRIEADMGRFGTVISDEIPAWLEEVNDTARGFMANTHQFKAWRLALRRAEQHVESLTSGATKESALKVLSRIREAVDKGRVELIEDALKWWHYDRQLYSLKRVVRTEMATATHNAIIDATIDDPDTIGYEWRLSSTHPRPDICDWYAGIDFGLGKGVFPKDQVPRQKAHPNCMCKLVAKTTRNKERGEKNLREFLQGLDPARKKAIMPAWARDLEAAGAPIEALVRPDGMGFRSMKEIRALMGEEKFGVAQKVGRAMNERVWTRLEAHVEKRMKEGFIKNARELDRNFERVLGHKETELWAIKGAKGEINKIYGLNRALNELIIVNKEGKRVTWFPMDKRGPDKFLDDERSRLKKSSLIFISLVKELWGK